MTTGNPEPANGPQPATTVEYRIGDSEREQAARHVISAAGSGYLTVAEADERIAKVYAAQWPSQLRTLLGDLPPTGDPPPAPVATAPPRGSGRHRLPLLPIVLFALVSAVFLGPWLHGLLWPALLLMLGALLVTRRRTNHHRTG